MRYFQGCGYSDEFTENMRYVISNLKNGSEVLLTRGCDDICRKCPNNRKNMCCDGEKVKSYDSAVISSCNLDFDKVYEYGCLYSLVENNIIKKICSALYAATANGFIYAASHGCDKNFD